MSVAPAFFDHSPWHGSCPACSLVYSSFLFPCIWLKTEKSSEVDLHQCTLCLLLAVSLVRDELLSFLLFLLAVVISRARGWTCYVAGRMLVYLSKEETDIDKEWVEQKLVLICGVEVRMGWEPRILALGDLNPLYVYFWLGDVCITMIGIKSTWYREKINIDALFICQKLIKNK